MSYRIIDPQVIRASAENGDGVYPYAKWKPLPENATQRKIADPTLFIMHTMGGPRTATPDQLWEYMARPGATSTESTWILGFDGYCLQVMGVTVEAHANYKANGFASSCETQDNGSAALETTPWTPEQVEQLAGIAAWKHFRNGTPIRLPQSWTDDGVGYHRQFAEWSGRGLNHSCPGAARIAQVPAVHALAKQIIAEGEEDMPLTDQDVAKIAEAVWDRQTKVYGSDDTVRSMSWFATRTQRYTRFHLGPAYVSKALPDRSTLQKVHDKVTRLVKGSWKLEG